MIESPNREMFYGDSIRWFVGQVVSVDDPIQLARIQVRIFGIHGEEISDEDLPWAQVVAPVTGGGTTFFGNQLGIRPGAHVHGIFTDGQSSQCPLVYGSYPKYEPTDDDSYEKSVSKLARGIQTDSYEPDEVIGEPDDPFAAEYPHNLVYKTHAGHVKEYDNTPDATRIRELHQSGTFYQINHDGDLVTHIVRDRYTLVVSDDAIHVKGNVNVFIDKDANITVGDNATISIDKNATVDVGQSATVDVGQNLVTTVNGNTTINTTSGEVRIDTPQTTMTGNLRVDGLITAGEDVQTDDGVSLNDHTHIDTKGLGAAITSAAFGGGG